MFAEMNVWSAIQVSKNKPTSGTPIILSNYAYGHIHGDAIKWKHFFRVTGPLLPVNSPLRPVTRSFDE